MTVYSRKPRRQKNDAARWSEREDLGAEVMGEFCGEVRGSQETDHA